MQLAMSAVGNLPGVAIKPAVCNDAVTDEPASRSGAETGKMEKTAVRIALAVPVAAGNTDGAILVW